MYQGKKRRQGKGGLWISIILAPLILCLGHKLAHGRVSLPIQNAGLRPKLLLFPPRSQAFVGALWI